MASDIKKKKEKKNPIYEQRFENESRTVFLADILFSVSWLQGIKFNSNRQIFASAADIMS